MHTLVAAATGPFQDRATDVWWLQRFTPRTAKSAWSKINRAKVEALIANGKMEAPGLAEMERAKCDGQWACAYDGARSSSGPADLIAAFARTDLTRPRSPSNPEGSNAR